MVEYLIFWKFTVKRRGEERIKNKRKEKNSPI
jgi:hypothetical protein